jgi:hypothetical protein
MIAQIIVAVTGIWLMASPAFLDISGTAEDMNHIFGPVIASFAVIAWWEVTRNLRYANIFIAVWLIISPWLLGYDNNSAIINNVIVGGIVGLLSFVKGKIKSQFGGGWRSLFK